MKIVFNMSDEEINTVYRLLDIDIPEYLDEEELAEDLHYFLKIMKDEFQ